MESNREMEIPRKLINELSNVFLRNQWEDKNNFLLSCLENGIQLAKRSSLSPQNLSRRLQKEAKTFLVYNDLSLREFTPIIYEKLAEYLPEIIFNLVDDIDSFFETTKFEIQRLSWREIYNNGSPKEKFGQQLILQRMSAYFDQSGIVYKEVSDGRGIIDILLVQEMLEIIVETKLGKNYKGTQQLQKYINSRPNGRRGYFIVFDESQNQRFEKICDISMGRYSHEKALKTINIWINPPKPSTGTH